MVYKEMDGFKVVLCSNPENLKAAQPHITIEAEYGDTVVSGSLATFAHHGSRSGNPAPCIDDRARAFGNSLQWVAGNILDPGAALIIGLSHFDLDSLGGCIRVMGILNGIGGIEFWGLAAQADIRGPHTLDKTHPNYDQLAAFWAWSETHRLYAPRDGSVLDVTEKIREAIGALRSCIGRAEDFIKAGTELLTREAHLNSASYCECEGGAIKRISGSFTNHLYCTPRGDVQYAVVALNESQASVTVSFAMPIPGVSAKDIVQSLWGPEAGGRDVIAGSPRDRKMTTNDLNDAYRAVVSRLNQ